MNSSNAVRPWLRIVVLVLAVGALLSISWVSTGRLVPEGRDEVLLFQSSLLLVVLGSLILERHFTRPGDALVNSLTATITLLPLLAAVPSVPAVALLSYLGLVLITATVSVVLQDQSPRSNWLRQVQRISYEISAGLGRARILFSVVFVVALVFFVEARTTFALALLVFWGMYLALWPLGIPQFLTALLGRSKRSEVLGQITRVDSPDIVRVSLPQEVRWTFAESTPVTVHLRDGQNRWALPLVSESTSEGNWGTLLMGSSSGVGGPAGTITRGGDLVPERASLIEESVGDPNAVIVGIVREGSTVSELRIETLRGAALEVGGLVVARVGSDLVYYEATQAETAEERFTGLEFGSHLVSASQVGSFDGRKFRRSTWLPAMNAPVFQLQAPLTQADAGSDFVLGQVPGVGVELRGRFLEGFTSHTAILGATGTGKTEFTFEIIRHAVEQGVKVICIDLTAQYADRLDDLSPTALSIEETTADELGQKLFDADTGKFGGGDEKRVLAGFAAPIRDDVAARLKRFLSPAGGALGIIELREISNSKATLWITEMYLSGLLRVAKAGDLNGEQVLVVVEEAHTVMPEPSFVGLGDYDSKGTVAKITQIALQGRKYGVGLLVVSQRTATVSKSVLTQCATIVSFSCIDDTSINFLSNMFGSSVARSLPMLKRLRAVAYGEWIASELPVTFDVPFDSGKVARSSWRPGTTSIGVPSPAEPTASPPDPSEVPF